MPRDYSRPHAPRRVADLLRRLSENAEREQAERRKLAGAIASLLDAPTEGPEGLAPLLRALAAAAPEIDSAVILSRSDAGFSIAAASGIELAERFEPAPGARSIVVDAVQTRAPAVASAPGTAAAPLPAGTLAAAAVPAMSLQEVLAVVVVGSRSAPEVAPESLLLARVVAERAGRALERRTLVGSLSSAEALARRTSAFRDQILGIVGHDLRNPLGAVTMSAALLAKRGGLAGWQQKTVGRVRSSAARMERIIADLLSYTRTRLGSGIPIDRRGADLGELARKVVDELVAFHPDSPIQLDVEGDLSGEWDPARLEQALSNLVSNAVDHGDPDARVVVALRGRDEGAVHVEVVNRGEIPPSVLEHAFEPFQRPSEREARRASGLGLGLYIAREIVRGHGGTIAARSHAGETHLEVHLPRRPSDVAAR